MTFTALAIGTYNLGRLGYILQETDDSKAMSVVRARSGGSLSQDPWGWTEKQAKKKAAIGRRQRGFSNTSV